MSLIQITDLTRVYGSGEAAVTALDHVSLAIAAGEFVAIMGPSGSGKSTLLQLLGGLDQASSGEIRIGEQVMTQLDDDALTALRRKAIGFVFQAYNLIPVLSAVENVALPLVLDGVNQQQAQQRAAEWLRRLGLETRLHHRPDQLSGGQQQRVGIARALVTEPALILADEPTGNLDSHAAADIAEVLRRSAHEWQRTVVMVTHDLRMASYADRVIALQDGRIVQDGLQKPQPAQFAEVIR